MTAIALAACSGNGGIDVGSTTTGPAPAAPTYTVGGSVTGLTGAGLLLQDNSGDSLPVAADGSFTFATPLDSGNSYNVTVSGQPGTPTQSCVVTNGIGVIASASVTNIGVVCTDKTVPLDTIGGTVVGLSGSGLVLQDDGADNLAATEGPFTFATGLPSGVAYNVTVSSPPVNPNQNCVVTNGTGTTGASNVANVVVTCTTTVQPTFTIGGTVAGVSAAGLTIVLQDNGRDNLLIKADGSFTFPMAIPSGSAYRVAPLNISGPSGESYSCAFTNATGLVGKNAITNVGVNCQAQVGTGLDTIQVNVSGLAGSGLILQDNAGDNLAISNNGTASFATQLLGGSPYHVTVLSQPTSVSQTCLVTNGAGTAAAAQITVTVHCTTNVDTVSATVTGLLGTGLGLQDNAGTSLAISANGTYVLPGAVASGSAYSVTVAAQPRAPSQTCVVSNGTGTIGVANVTVAVACVTNVYTVSAMVSGLVGTGLTLQDNGGASLPIAANGTFVLPGTVASQTTYNVTAPTQPAGPTQVCMVANGTGVATVAPITVIVTCATRSFSVGGSVAGLVGTGLTLQDNGGGNLNIVANGGFTFTAPVASGSAYAVAVLTQPNNPSQTCVIANGSGTVGAGPVGNVAVTCTTNNYTVGGTVSGLSGSGLSLALIGETAPASLNVTANGNFVFPGSIASGGSYSVSVSTQPNTPSQTCTVTNASGPILGTNIQNVTIACQTNYTIGGTVSGLNQQAQAAGTLNVGLAGQSSAYNLKLAANGAFTFAPTYTSGGTYTVDVTSQPTGAGESCAVTNGSGTVGAANVTNVAITCTSNAGDWTWAAGSNTQNQDGVYGAQGTGTSGSIPGARIAAASGAQGPNGTLWLFGGYGYGTTPNSQLGYLNDLWTYNPSANQWIWVCGSNTVNPADQAQPQSMPDARETAASWSDGSGNLYVFGGVGDVGSLGGLWRYTPTQAASCANQWTLVNGSNGNQGESVNSAGVYGIRGTPAASNQPGARSAATTWTDANHNFWMFGGIGYDAAGTLGDLNDLWEYNPKSNAWTWVTGSTVVNAPAVYTSLETPLVPGARQGAVSWTDSMGNLWMFGGATYSTAANPNPPPPQIGFFTGSFNELWKFVPAIGTGGITGAWAFQGGTEGNSDPVGTYTAMGQAGIPAARYQASAWADSSGNLWLFGGAQVSTIGAFTDLNDLWEYVVSPTTGVGTWTWINGSNPASVSNAPGSYGALGLGAASNVPPARTAAAAWSDGSGYFWLFGGLLNTGSGNLLNDVWQFVP